MTLNQLKYFVAVAETHSFTKAAEQYFISQTAITQQIKALEQTMGCPLLDRSTRPIVLTPSGNVFYMEAKAVIERMENAVTMAQNASAGLEGTLSIGYTKGYERSGLFNKLQDFRLHYPNVSINCYRCTTDVLAAGLSNDIYDIIYTWDSTNLQQDQAYCSRSIEKAPLVVAVYASHPLAQRKTLRRQDLQNERILYMSPSESINSMGDAHFMELYKKAGYLPQITFRSTDTESILMMVASQQGISILPDYCTKKLDIADNLVFIPLKGKDEFEQIVTLWKADSTNQALKHFLEHIF